MPPTHSGEIAIPIPVLLVLIALVIASSLGWRYAKWRKPLAITAISGALLWATLWGAIHLMENAPLPDVRLTTLAGEATNLATLAKGKPMVVNLWATWCPPCRREMPVLAAAQKEHPEIVFVFANQGEGSGEVDGYLWESGLDLANVVLDTGAAVGREVGSSGMPTTLFYDADGHMVDSRVGGLTTDLLASKLQIFGPRSK